MKVKIGSYRSHVVSNIHENYMDRKYGGKFKWEDNSTRFEFALDKIEMCLQLFYDNTINRIIDRSSTRNISVRIDRSDVWSMDHTLSYIIHPMLIELKESKQGAPWTEMKDVPKELRATKAQIDKANETGDADDNHFKRWDWILDEMIWAFEQKCKDDWEADYYDFEDDPDALFKLKMTRNDEAGRKAHQARMSNGFRLFGKYYENLWN